MKNEAILNQLYKPNDKLGVQMFGSVNWARMKGTVCGLTNAAISRNYKPQGPYTAQYNQLFEVLFRPQRQKFNELLGADAPIDLIPSDWARGISKIGEGVTNALKNIPFFTPWISAGRSINAGLADILKKFGLTSYGESSDSNETTILGLNATTVLIIGGVGVGVYLLLRKRKRRRRRG